jgi:hypothetical protein
MPQHFVYLCVVKCPEVELHILVTERGQFSCRGDLVRVKYSVTLIPGIFKVAEKI